MYLYVLHGGTLPERYREIVYMREFGLKPWEMDPDRPVHATLGDLLDWQACLEGEQRARRRRGGGSSSGGGSGGGALPGMTAADYAAKGLPVPQPTG